MTGAGDNLRSQLGRVEAKRERAGPGRILHIQVRAELNGSRSWVARHTQSQAPELPAICCRFAIAALAFWPYFKRVDKDIYKAGVEIGVWAAIGTPSQPGPSTTESDSTKAITQRFIDNNHAFAGYLAQAQGLLTTDASHASFISTLTVLVVPILAGLSGKGVKTLTWVSAIAAFIGVGFLEDGFSMPCDGDMWQLLSAIAFGVQASLSPQLPECIHGIISLVYTHT